MQIGFIVWQEALKDNKISELYYSFYIFFMFGSCFIVLKVNIYFLLIFKLIYIQNHNLISSLKKINEWIKKNNINLPLCQLAEKAIIKYCPQQNMKEIDSPSLFMDTIYNEVFKAFYSANDSNLKYQNSIYEQFEQLKKTSITILQFALCEYDIYSKFNQIIIVFSSCLISAKEKDVEIGDNKIGNIYQNFINIIKTLKIDFSLIEKCMAKITDIFNSEDNSSDENTCDEESPKFQFQKENIASFTKLIENDMSNLEIKEQY